MRDFVRCCFVSFIWLYSCYSFAYEIGAFSEGGTDRSLKTDKYGKFIFEKNHEVMTALSLKCLADENAGMSDIVNFPEQCNVEKLSIELLEKFIFNNILDFSYPNQINDYVDLIRFVRWSDDPTRMIDHDEEAAGKFGLLLKGGECQSRKDKNGLLTLINDGQLCNSHFGKLQFLHAMANTNKNKKSQPAKYTRQLIDQWVAFSYDVARGNIKWGTQVYCEFWRDKENKNAKVKYPELAKLMYEPELEKDFCRDRWTLYDVITPWYGPTLSWKVGTPFRFKCSNPIISSSCDEILDDKNMVIKSALGSILHLFQDSYSKAHTNRGGNDTEPEILLSRVISYREYNGQNHDKHTLSDKRPSFKISYNKNATLDPITAGAQLIWLYHTGGNGTLSINDITMRVFGEVSDTDPDSSPGEDYLD